METLFLNRNTPPSLSDPNWVRYDKGGNNYCIEIKEGSVLPNCVGYAWGRWIELLNIRPRLSRGNAENWWGVLTDGYERGQTPKLGAVACWRKGEAGNSRDGAGHVSIVEDILPDGSIVTSNSGYAGSYFYMRTIKPPYNIGLLYTFQGFIYPPKNFVKTLTPKLNSADIAKEVLTGKWGNGADRKARLISAGYDPIEIQNLVNLLVSAKVVVPPKSVDLLANEVINGQWGSGNARKVRLERAGYDYKAVQIRVNQLLAINRPKKSLNIVAKEVLAGKWGNGIARKEALTKAGYVYRHVQLAVNELLKK